MLCKPRFEELTLVDFTAILLGFHFLHVRDAESVKQQVQKITAFAYEDFDSTVWSGWDLLGCPNCNNMHEIFKV